VTSDDDVRLHARSLFDQVRRRSYMQSLGGPLYARKHDPAAIFGKDHGARPARTTRRSSAPATRSCAAR